MNPSQPSTPRTVPPVLAIEMIEVAIGSLAQAGAVVLEGVNWKMAVGDYWVIGGLQGSGKSDLMATAAGRMAPVHGILRASEENWGAGFDHKLLPIRLGIGVV